MNKTSIVLVSILVGILAAFPAAPVAAFESFVVQRIRVIGLQRVSEAAVLNDLPISVGQSLTENEASEAICALYQTGFFKDVALSRDGNTLVVKVIERPSISKLTVTGIKEKEKINKLLKEAGLVEGRMYDPSVVARAQKELEKFYFTKGRYGVHIEPKVVETPSGLIEVTLCISEGETARIKQIKIVGNCAFSEKELIKDFYSSKSNLLSWFTKNDQYAKEKLQADLENLRSYYMDRGYLEFQIDSTEVSLTPDKSCIYITIHVTEGQKFNFGCIDIDGCFVVPEGVLRRIIAPLRSGCTFSRRHLLVVKQQLEDAMGDAGYSMAEARPTHVVDECNRLVNITFHIQPGRRVYVRRIQICGNATTQDEVLRREIPQLEGTWISTCLVKEGKEKILRRGYARDVEIESCPVPGSKDQVDLLYTVEEARLGQIGAGLGYSATERLMFNFSVSQENFFGTGKTVDFSFDKSKSASNYALGYQDPYFTVDGVAMGASAYYNKAHLSKTTNISDYIADTVGAQTRWAFPMSKYDSVSLSLGYDDTHVRLSNKFAAAEIVAFTEEFGTTYQEVTVGLGWRHDSLDQRIFPKCGLMQSAGVSVTVPGSTLMYYKASYDFAWFYPLTESERWIVNLSSTLGFGNGLGKTPELPFYRHFYAGGTRFVRGYEENSLGPKDSRGRAYGGNALIAASANFIFPNPIKPDIKCVRTALFFDAGQVYDTRNPVVLNGQVFNHKVNGVRYSVGVSLTWHSPLGAPLTFSLAKPLNKKPGDQTRSFNFWMGTQF